MFHRHNFRYELHPTPTEIYTLNTFLDNYVHLSFCISLSLFFLFIFLPFFHIFFAAGGGAQQPPYSLIWKVGISYKFTLAFNSPNSLRFRKIVFFDENYKKVDVFGCNVHSKRAILKVQVHDELWYAGYGPPPHLKSNNR